MEPRGLCSGPGAGCPASTGVPEFDPRPFLGPENRRRFEYPLTYAAEPEPVKPVPRVRVHCKSEHIRGFLELLDSGLRLELLPLREVDLSRACGVFAVAKDGGRDRMVLDARRAMPTKTPKIPAFGRWLLLSNFATFS